MKNILRVRKVSRATVRAFDKLCCCRVSYGMCVCVHAYHSLTHFLSPYLLSIYRYILYAISQFVHRWLNVLRSNLFIFFSRFFISVSLSLPLFPACYITPKNVTRDLCEKTKQTFHMTFLSIICEHITN